MSDEVTPERVAIMAAAGRVRLSPESCARVAGAIGPVVARVAAENLAMPLEIEPASFTAIARREIGR
jgi:hypothetical protein